MLNKANRSGPSLSAQERITEMFDRIAKRYDFLNSLLSCRQDKRWRRKLVSWIPTKSSSSSSALLDVATGTGDVVLKACEAHQEYASFVGVDLSAAMLDRAREKAEKAGSQHVEFSLADGRELPFEANVFDCVTISFGLRNIQGVRQALEEFHRVLKPGGSLLILEFFQPQNTLMTRVFRGYFSWIMPRIAGLFSSRQDYSYLPESVENFYTVQQLTTLCKESGLSLKRQHRFLFGICWLTDYGKEPSADREPSAEKKPSAE